MQTNLNEKIEEFFSKYENEDITIENIKKHFNDINEENEYGNLLHAAVHHKFSEEKVLKFIEILLSNGVNCNLKGKNTGYSFIHLALYGYTENDKDYSYTTDFIVKLITIARKHDFNVQIVDDDSDSLIHTALASEIYTGSTVEIIKALGSEYNISCKDNQGNDIYNALLKYKNEAKKDKNDSWYKRLLIEENDIKKLVEMNKYNIEEINEHLSVLKKQLEDIFKNITIEDLLNNYPRILEIKKELECYVLQQKLFNENETEYDTLWSKCDVILKEMLTVYIKKISNCPSYKAINDLFTLLETFGYSQEIESLNNIKNKYGNYIETLNKEIDKCETLKELKIVELKLNSLKDKEILEQLFIEYEKKYNFFQGKIAQIKNLLSLIEITSKWMDDNLIKRGYYQGKTFDYNSMTMKEFETMNLELTKQLQNNKDKIQEAVKSKLNDLFQTIFSLKDSSAFNNDELWQIIDSTIDEQRQIPKQKVKRRNKEQ